MKKLHGQAFHRALRKHLSGDASSIAWNAINLTTQEQWGRFIDAVNAETGTLEERCHKVVIFGESALNLLAIGLRMLTPQEFAILERHCWYDDETEGKEYAVS